jgi:hypothetical protein
VKPPAPTVSDLAVIVNPVPAVATQTRSRAAMLARLLHPARPARGRHRNRKAGTAA